MKHIKLKSILFFIFIPFLTMSGQNEGSTFFESVAIINIESVDSTNGNFFYEITLKDFSRQINMPEGFGFKGYTFMDNGLHNDKKANDGVYTAKELRPKTLLNKNPISQTVFYDVSFKYQNQLNSSDRGIGCEFEPCGCPSSCGYCPACDFFGWECWTVTKCEIIIA